MRRFRRSARLFLHIVLSTGLAALAAACSVYDGDLGDRRPEAGGSSGGAGGSGAGGSGASGDSGSAGAAAGTGGTSGGADGSMSDASSADGDATIIDTNDNVGDATDIGAPGDDDHPNDTADASDDGPTVADASDAGPPDGSVDAPNSPDADASMPDAGSVDAFDSGPTGPQILPQHGWPVQKPDAGGPFDSRCASDEVVTGFVARAGVQTDAIASTCSKLIGGVLSSPRNLPLNGNVTGGNAVTVVCPANYVAVGIVGRYGHNTMWMENVTTAIGVVCKDLGSATTQIVTITTQPALDAGYTTFREDCTGGRYLTDISGRTDSNSLGFTVQQVGGECDVR